MNEFFARLKQRKLVQWALAYIAAAFALIQVLDVIAQRFGWPDQLEKLLILALAIGFLVAMVLAWYHGERGAQKVSGTEIVILALLLAIGGGLLWRFERVAQTTGNASITSATAMESSESAVPSTNIPAKSIAVLAFTDLSPHHDQGYFSDGMSEEILNALAQVNDLKVAGRTSSFYYKGRNEDLRTIGKALGVANILEGSVRKQGNEVRITAQLIRVADDTHLWSHAYDGNLSDVFKLQEDIARAITDQLQVVLVGGQKTRLVQVATINPEAYTLYLKATDAFNDRDYARMGDAIGWLQQALKLDPGFARAHSRLAMIHVLGHAQYGASLTEADREARLALELDPTDAEAQVALSLLARKQRRFQDARSAMDRALELAPSDASVQLYAAQDLIITGYTREGIARLDHAMAIDPLLPNALYWRGRQYLYDGDLDAATRLFKQASSLGLSFASAGLASVARARGDYVQARLLAEPFFSGPTVAKCLKNPAVSVPVYLNGLYDEDASARNKAIAVIDECLASRPAVVPLFVPEGLLLFEPAKALEVAVKAPTTDDAGFFMDFWGPLGREARRLPALAAFARKVGFAALWEKYGPPDLCKKNSAGDYVCQ